MRINDILEAYDDDTQSLYDYMAQLVAEYKNATSLEKTSIKLEAKGLYDGIVESDLTVLTLKGISEFKSIIKPNK